MNPDRPTPSRPVDPGTSEVEPRCPHISEAGVQCRRREGHPHDHIYRWRDLMAVRRGEDSPS